MNDALIGHTGFVGGSLMRQRTFAACYNSRNIENLAGQEHDLVICAGAPGKKWLANREPEADWASIDRLISTLARTKSKKFVLISTVDVFPFATGVDERSPINDDTLSPYGKHRHELERAVTQIFPSATIIRLPGLVGPYLQKNPLYDLKHRHELFKIHPESRYQFYPMVNLWSDLQKVLRLSLPLVHFSCEPVRIGDVARDCFDIQLNKSSESLTPVSYDLRSHWARQLGGQLDYLYSARETLLAIRAYAQASDRVDTAQPPHRSL